MRKLYTFLVLSTFFFVSKAQVDVTFQVDMNTQTVSGNGVHIAGNFQDAVDGMGNWRPGDHPLKDDDGDGVYTLTVQLPAGDYEYKFVNGNAWGGDESVPGSCATNGNRGLTVATTNVTTDLVCFGTCDPCPTAIDTFDWTLKVDMSGQTVDPAGVHVAGAFQGWDPAKTKLTNTSGDIWETTVRVTQGTYQFKFVNGDAWGKDESQIPSECNVGGNREVKLSGNGDNVNDGNLKASYFVAFNQCLPVDSIDVTFNVNMQNEDAIDANGVHIAGSLQGWDPGATSLSDDNGDNIYSVTLRVPAGSYQFKFLNGNAWGFEENVPSACNVGGNREIEVSGNGDAKSDILSVDFSTCFGECTEDCPVKLPPINMTFRVDMSNEIVDANGLFIAGNFTSPAWVKDSFELKPTSWNADIYEITFEKVEVGEYQYVYFNGGEEAGKEEYDFETAGCGSGNGLGGWNRVFNTSGRMGDTTLPTYIYGSCNISTASIDGIHMNQFKMYPNPAKNTVSLYLENSLINNVEVLDIYGRCIKSLVTNNKATVSIDVASFRKGMYLVRVVNNLNQVATQKLIIK